MIFDGGIRERRVERSATSSLLLLAHAHSVAFFFFFFVFSSSSLCFFARNSLIPRRPLGDPPEPSALSQTPDTSSRPP